jgi:hypothetical protein
VKEPRRLVASPGLESGTRAASDFVGDPPASRSEPDHLIRSRLEQLRVVRDCCAIVERLAAEPYDVGWSELITMVLECRQDLSAVCPEPRYELVESLARQRLDAQAPWAHPAGCPSTQSVDYCRSERR